MNDFAKMFNHPNHGQIVVIADEDSDGNPAFVFEPYVETISEEDAEVVCNAVQC